MAETSDIDGVLLSQTGGARELTTLSSFPLKSEHALNKRTNSTKG